MAGAFFAGALAAAFAGATRLGCANCGHRVAVSIPDIARTGQVRMFTYSPAAQTGHLPIPSIPTDPLCDAGYRRLRSNT
ncbi:hypothetical protein [Inquilinus sp.]|uniref:hypothetical protein n=1 Tax=Inquilinus sp. TaxID=1932117 RepID=UPI0037839B58